MTIKVTYICDKCGAEQPTINQFWTVGVAVKSGNSAPIDQFNDSFVPGKSIQVCRPCLESFGLYVSPKKKQNPDYNPPSIEDLFREIIEICSD